MTGRRHRRPVAAATAAPTWPRGAAWIAQTRVGGFQLVEPRVLAEQLGRAIGASRIVDDADVLASLAHDHAQGAPWQLPAVAARPTSTDEVARALQVAADLAVPVVVRGAGSGLADGANAVDGCLLLCTERLDRILQVDDVDRLAVVGAGVLNGRLKAEATDAGLFYPPDPASSAFCSIGGNIATDAGGLCCVRYGVTSSYVLGLTVVLADGTVVRLGAAPPRGSPGST